MKKLLLTLTLGMLMISSYAVTFDLGLKTGANISNFKFNYNSSNLRSDLKSGFLIGAFGRFGGDKLYLQPEILYTAKKGTLDLASSEDFKIHYVQIPVLVGLKAIDLKVASIRIFTGPSFSQATSSWSSIDQDLILNKSQWDWKFGAGVDVLMLSFEIRYELPITGVSIENFENRVIKNASSFQATIGFKIL